MLERCSSSKDWALSMATARLTGDGLKVIRPLVVRFKPRAVEYFQDTFDLPFGDQWLCNIGNKPFLADKWCADKLLFDL